MSRCSGEMVNHLLAYCFIVMLLCVVVWCFFPRFGVQWVMSLTVTSLLFGWRNWFGKALFSSLEFSVIMFDVVCVEGMQFSHIRILRDPLINWNPYCCVSYLSGLGLGILLIVLLFLSFTLLLALLCNLLNSVFTIVNVNAFFSIKLYIYIYRKVQRMSDVFFFSLVRICHVW